MTKFSDLHGRLLEYLIVEALMKLDSQVKLSENAKADQLSTYAKLITYSVPKLSRTFLR
jgi:hypothetical protein